MTRLAEHRLGGNEAYNAGSSVDALDLKYGYQQGFATDIASFKNNSAHKSNQLVAILLQAPRGYEALTDGQKFVEALKAIIEVHSLTITGFNDQLNVDMDQHTVGSAGAVQQEFVNVTREQPTPSHSFVDKDGRSIQKFFEHYIRYLMADPETNSPLLPIVGTRNIRSMGAEMYTFSTLYFEPNLTMTGINRAWLCVNMMPMTSGPGESRRDLTQGAQILQYDVQFSALAQVGYGVDDLALSILNSINLLNADNYFRRAAYAGITADVKAVDDTGFIYGAERVGQEAISNVHGIK